VRGTVEAICRSAGLTPIICTPEELPAGSSRRMKRRDAIIDELQRVREDFGKVHDFDVRRIAATIRRHEDENPEGIIRESPKRTTRQKKAS